MNATVRSYPEQLAAAEDRNELAAPSLPKHVTRRGRAQRRHAAGGYLISPGIHPLAQVGPEQKWKLLEVGSQWSIWLLHDVAGVLQRIRGFWCGTS